MSHWSKIDQANQRTGVELEDTRRWAYDYDDLGQVTSAQKRLADDITSLPGYDFGYTFDDIGNRATTTVNARSSTYTPNLLNQYDSRTVPGAFDVRGEAHPAATVTVNTDSTTRTDKDFYREVSAANTSAPVNASIVITATEGSETVSDAVAGFLARTPESFAPDLDGNLTEDGRWSCGYDAENRLISVETPTALVLAFPALKKRATFAYDSQSRRIRKHVETWDAALNDGLGGWTSIADLRFIYEGWNLLTELDALNSNAVVCSHVWGLDLSGTMQGAGGVGGLLWTNTATHTFAPSADANGNIVAWVNTATLAVAGRADYGAFGEVVMQTGVAKELPFGFSTKYTDRETGLLYYGFRYYNPSTGCWLSRDPIEENGGFNLYGMVDNDAVNLTDILGLIILIEGDDSFKQGVEQNLEKIKNSDPVLSKLVEALRTTTKATHRILKLDKGYSYNIADNSVRKTISADDPEVSTNTYYNICGNGNDPVASLAHELHHAWELGIKLPPEYPQRASVDSNGVKYEEYRAVRTENIYREAAGLEARTTYGSKQGQITIPGHDGKNSLLHIFLK